MYIDFIMCYTVCGGDFVAKPKMKTNAQVKNDYAKKAYDDIRLQVKKGKKDLIKSHAEQQGFDKLQSYIKKLISDDMGGLDL